MKYHAKADRNQPTIVAAFRAAGFTVQHLHTVGRGCPDLAVGRGGVTTLVEIKDGNKDLTEAEKQFFSSWRGSATVVRSIDDVVELAKLLP